MNPWIYDHTGLFLILFLGGFTALFVWAANEDCKERNRLVQQCIADGRKEYECRAMFRQNNTYVPHSGYVPRVTGKH